jgi:hypothetical protein
MLAVQRKALAGPKETVARLEQRRVDGHRFIELQHHAISRKQLRRSAQQHESIDAHECPAASRHVVDPNTEKRVRYELLGNWRARLPRGAWSAQHEVVSVEMLLPIDTGWRVSRISML